MVRLARLDAWRGDALRAGSAATAAEGGRGVVVGARRHLPGGTVGRPGRRLCVGCEPATEPALGVGPGLSHQLAQPPAVQVDGDVADRSPFESGPGLDRTVKLVRQIDGGFHGSCIAVLPLSCPDCDTSDRKTVNTPSRTRIRARRLGSPPHSGRGAGAYAGSERPSLRPPSARPVSRCEGLSLGPPRCSFSSYPPAPGQFHDAKGLPERGTCTEIGA